MSEIWKAAINERYINDRVAEYMQIVFDNFGKKRNDPLREDWELLSEAEIDLVRTREYRYPQVTIATLPPQEAWSLIEKQSGGRYNFQITREEQVESGTEIGILEFGNLEDPGVSFSRYLLPIVGGARRPIPQEGDISDGITNFLNTIPNTLLESKKNRNKMRARVVYDNPQIYGVDSPVTSIRVRK